MRELEEGIFVSGQISPGDMSALAARGIRTILNNRPDGEVPGQPAGSMIRLAAEQAGIGYVSIPISRITDTAVEQTRRALEQAERPLLAFCAVGARSSYLWALARSDALEGGELEARAAGAGYDLSPIRHLLA